MAKTIISRYDSVLDAIYGVSSCSLHLDKYGDTINERPVYEYGSDGNGLLSSCLSAFDLYQVSDIIDDIVQDTKLFQEALDEWKTKMLNRGDQVNGPLGDGPLEVEAIRIRTPKGIVYIEGFNEIFKMSEAYEFMKPYYNKALNAVIPVFKSDAKFQEWYNKQLNGNKVARYLLTSTAKNALIKTGVKYAEIFNNNHVKSISAQDFVKIYFNDLNAPGLMDQEVKIINQNGEPVKVKVLNVRLDKETLKKTLKGAGISLATLLTYLALQRFYTWCTSNGNKIDVDMPGLENVVKVDNVKVGVHDVTNLKDMIKAYENSQNVSKLRGTPVDLYEHFLNSLRCPVNFRMRTYQSEVNNFDVIPVEKSSGLHASFCSFIDSMMRKIAILGSNYRLVNAPLGDGKYGFIILSRKAATATSTTVDLEMVVQSTNSQCPDRGPEYLNTEWHLPLGFNERDSIVLFFIKETWTVFGKVHDRATPMTLVAASMGTSNELHFIASRPIAGEITDESK